MLEELQEEWNAQRVDEGLSIILGAGAKEKAKEKSRAKSQFLPKPHLHFIKSLKDHFIPNPEFLIAELIISRLFIIS